MVQALDLGLVVPLAIFSFAIFTAATVASAVLGARMYRCVDRRPPD